MRTTGSSFFGLSYSKAAEHFTEALPLGNGSLGAMIYGGVPGELLKLNHDTLWSGGPSDFTNPEARTHLPEVRKLLFDGKYSEAEALCRKMQGPYTQAYLPMADLEITFDHDADAKDYRRRLSLSDALASVEYTAGGVRYQREAFVSRPDGALYLELSCGTPGGLTCSFALSSPLRHQSGVAGDDSSLLILSGRAPSHVNPSYYNRDVNGRELGPDEVVRYEEGKGLEFCVALSVMSEGGSVDEIDLSEAHDSAASGRSTPGITVRGASSVTLVLTATTGFAGWNRPNHAGAAVAEARRLLEKARTRDYDEAKGDHIADYRALFDRVTLELGAGPSTESSTPGAATTDAATSDGDASGPAAPLDTDRRIEAFADTQDPDLVKLLFQYGRYLLISASRPGGQAANLQGIWNEDVRPPWSSNYTININTEMNYWPALVTGLPECNEPLVDLVANLSQSGRSVAETNYGCRGWVAHHNTDVWMLCCPVGDFGHGAPRWSLWPLGAAWLSQHLWEHYAFTGDKDYLARRGYPVMRGAAEFYLDWLIEDSEGHLVTAPSTSPEHGFRTADGGTCAVSIATTADIAMIWDLFTNCIEATEALGVDEAFRTELLSARGRLKPPVIRPDGALSEWSELFEDEDPHHRHHSHVFGIYPGRQITASGTPELYDAVRRSMEIRGDESTGWSLAWKVAIWARLRDGDRAYRILGNVLRLVPSVRGGGATYTHGGGVYANMFGAHPPFQMDGNFGVTAAICELLLQSHEGRIELLPALPTAWPTGSITGLRARGGVTVDLSWTDGRLTAATLTADRDCEVVVEYGGKRRPVQLTTGQAVPVEP